MEDCCVCLEPRELAVMPPCNHKVCRRCATTIFEMAQNRDEDGNIKNARCPICRTEWTKGPTKYLIHKFKTATGAKIRRIFLGSRNNYLDFRKGHDTPIQAYPAWWSYSQVSWDLEFRNNDIKINMGIIRQGIDKFYEIAIALYKIRVDIGLPLNVDIWIPCVFDQARNFWNMFDIINRANNTAKIEFPNKIPNDIKTETELLIMMPLMSLERNFWLDDRKVHSNYLAMLTLDICKSSEPALYNMLQRKKHGECYLHPQAIDFDRDGSWNMPDESKF